ncbi:hypothetical protein HDV00_005254 [Rhizophlyctis rosea]|nr:hypothetical protein HDV00_005254 [Rhizophlyctis rosea]
MSSSRTQAQDPARPDFLVRVFWPHGNTWRGGAFHCRDPDSNTSSAGHVGANSGDKHTSRYISTTKSFLWAICYLSTFPERVVPVSEPDSLSSLTPSPSSSQANATWRLRNFALMDRRLMTSTEIDFTDTKIREDKIKSVTARNAASSAQEILYEITIPSSAMVNIIKLSDISLPRDNNRNDHDTIASALFAIGSDYGNKIDKSTDYNAWKPKFFAGFATNQSRLELARWLVNKAFRRVTLDQVSTWFEADNSVPWVSALQSLITRTTLLPAANPRRRRAHPKDLKGKGKARASLSDEEDVPSLLDGSDTDDDSGEHATSTGKGKEAETDQIDFTAVFMGLNVCAKESIRRQFVELINNGGKAQYRGKRGWTLSSTSNGRYTIELQEDGSRVKWCGKDNLRKVDETQPPANAAPSTEEEAGPSTPPAAANPVPPPAVPAPPTIQPIQVQPPPALNTSAVRLYRLQEYKGCSAKMREYVGQLASEISHANGWYTVRLETSGEQISWRGKDNLEAV